MNSLSYQLKRGKLINNKAQRKFKKLFKNQILIHLKILIKILRRTMKILLMNLYIANSVWS